VRVAITGTAVGPGLFDCLAVLGQEASLRRIDAALERVSAAPATPAAPSNPAK
jgi:hypothetical protein